MGKGEDNEHNGEKKRLKEKMMMMKGREREREMMTKMKSVSSLFLPLLLFFPT